MLLPQSSAFAALKNRLNSVSSIGYLHIAPRPYVLSVVPQPRRSSMVEAIAKSLNDPSSLPRTQHSNTHTLTINSTAATASSSNYDRSNRLKGREDSVIRWNELLEKFRSVQDRARRAQRPGRDVDKGGALGVGDLRLGDGLEAMKAPKELNRAPIGPSTLTKDPPAPSAPSKPRSGLGRQFGRLGGAVSGRAKRNQQ